MTTIVLLLYLLLINLITYLTFGHDKRQARMGGRRVPEFRLLLLAALGGAAGAWLGMRRFRHKTQKPMFRILVPLLLLLQLALPVAAVLRRFL